MLRMISLIGCLMLTICLGVPSAWAVNNALSLDGDGDYVEVLDDDSLDLTVFTLEAWAWFAPPANPELFWSIIGKGEDFSTDNLNYILLLDRFELGEDQLQVRYEKTNDMEVLAMAPNSVLYQTWYHVAGVRNNSGTLQLFVNGELAASAFSTNPPSVGSSPLYIGTLFEAFGYADILPKSFWAFMKGLIMDYFGQRVSSGIYYYTLQADTFRATRKMLILK